MSRLSAIRLLLLAGLIASVGPASGADRFRRLTGLAVSNWLAGKTVGDDAHWSYHFGNDGGMVAMDLGREKQGVWRVSRGELCLDFTEKGKPLSECYELWIDGERLRFMRDGIVVIEGAIVGE